MRVAINGFGRIGRMIVRQLLTGSSEGLELVVINSTSSVEQTALLLEFDSIHGNFAYPVHSHGDTIRCKDRVIPIINQRDPSMIDWSKYDVDLVMECTGAFNDGEKAFAHVASGAKRVLISAPAENVDRTVVYGVNHEALGLSDIIISNASCTTNCLAPVAKVLDETFGIESGYMTTIHAVTGDQTIIDSRHKDPRRGRAAYQSIVPTKTGAAEALGAVLPNLRGKVLGSAIRVPTANVSMVDFVFKSSLDLSKEAINQCFIDASNLPSMERTLTTNARPLVSTDFNGTTHSAIVDLSLTEEIDRKAARVVAWYDNEWAFSARMLDTARAISSVHGWGTECIAPHSVSFNPDLIEINARFK